jgi:hypothetical protein
MTVHAVMENVKFFNTKLAVFYFYFQMCTTLQLAPAHNIIQETVNAFVMQEMIPCLHSDER